MNDRVVTEQYRQIETICLRLLARREHSRKELREKLALRGFDPHETLRVVEALAEQGWQNDRRYAESFVRQRMEKGYGPVRICYELKQQGIEFEGLDAIAEECVDSWATLLEKIYLQKYDDDRRLTAEAWLKRSRFLHYRGFSGDMIKALFEHLEIRLEG